MELYDSEYNNYPPKPIINANSKNNLFKSLISLLLFVFLFLIFLPDFRSLFLILLILFIHEGGHFFAMKLFKYQDVSIFFIPLMGAVTTGEKEKISQWQHAFIIMAGPLPGIILGLLCFFWGNHIEHIIVQLAGVMFIFINVLNLIPLDPLEGGKLLETLFFSNNDKLKIIFIFSSTVLLSLLGIYFFNLILIILALLMFSKLRSFLDLKKVRLQIHKENINLNCSYKDLSDENYWKIREIYLSSSSVNKLVKSKRFSDDQNEKLIAPIIKNMLQSTIDNDMRLYAKLLYVIAWISSFIIPIIIIYPFLSNLLMNAE